MRGGWVAAGLAAAVLAGCVPEPEPPGRPPAERPEAPAAPAEPEIAPRSQASEDLALYYRRLQADLVDQGLLRTDDGAEDAPYTASQLARNFVRIALFDEYATSGDTLVPQQTLSVLRRWQRPVRIGVEFGGTVPEAQRVVDRAATRTYADRLARVTGHPVALVEADANFHVLVLNEDDRRAFGDRLRALVPGIAESSVRAFLEPGRSTLCLVIAFSDGTTAGYTSAVALIRGEHPDTLRLACLHEEIAQGLGLPNDYGQARPSIFNDDDEFGLLTGHDENLLRILYDSRMRAGMSVAEAAPVAREIAEELVGGEG